MENVQSVIGCEDLRYHYEFNTSDDVPQTFGDIYKTTINPLDNSVMDPGKTWILHPIPRRNRLKGIEKKETTPITEDHQTPPGAAEYERIDQESDGTEEEPFTFKWG